LNLCTATFLSILSGNVDQVFARKVESITRSFISSHSSFYLDCAGASIKTAASR
jgi:hypothetical protein